MVGALGPKMSALAGETADGVLFNWLTPEHAERTGRSVVEAATSVGRSRPSLMAYVRCALMPRASARFDEELGHYAGSASFQAHLMRMGVEAAATCVLGHTADALQAGIARFEAVLDETVVRAIVPSDTVADLVELMLACGPSTSG